MGIELITDWKLWLLVLGFAAGITLATIRNTGENRTPQPTAEEIQELKKEKANNRGQVFHEFLRGAAGQEKSK